MNQSQLILNSISDGEVKLNAVLQNETICLPQEKIAELFDVNVPAISKHLANIYDEGELNRESIVSKMETVQKVLAGEL